MDLRVLLALAVLALLVWLGSGALRGPTSSPAPSPIPEITAIEFPKEIPADGQQVLGTVTFKDPDGDVAEARFEVIEAVLFESFRFALEVQGQTKGHFAFYVYTLIPQEVTLRVTLIDRAGHVSQPVSFTFEATGEFVNTP